MGTIIDLTGSKPRKITVDASYYDMMSVQRGDYEFRGQPLLVLIDAGSQLELIHAVINAALYESQHLTFVLLDTYTKLSKIQHPFPMVRIQPKFLTSFLEKQIGESQWMNSKSTPLAELALTK